MPGSCHPKCFQDCTAFRPAHSWNADGINDIKLEGVVPSTPSSLYFFNPLTIRSLDFGEVKGTFKDIGAKASSTYRLTNDKNNGSVECQNKLVEGLPSEGRRLLINYKHLSNKVLSKIYPCACPPSELINIIFSELSFSVPMSISHF